MNVSLSPELERYIKSQVDSQRYQTASEVVREAVRMLWRANEQDKAYIESLKSDIKIGTDQLDRGQFVTISNARDKQQLLERVRRNGKARLAKRS